MEAKEILISQIEGNKGQIEGLPANPRFIREDKLQKLVKSIEEDPEMMSLRELLVYPLSERRFVIIGGNMRLEALKRLNYKSVPCKILPKETSVKKLQAYTIKDNASFGQWDWDLLANEWDEMELLDWGVDMPFFDPNAEADETDRAEENEPIDEDEGDFIMLRDILFPTDNDMEIPTLLIEKQADRVELPITPWGKNARTRKDIKTYHFYVDDYRFEKLFKDPENLIFRLQIQKDNSNRLKKDEK